MADVATSARPVAPATMGGLVAALGAVELRKLLAGEWEHALVGRELYIDARHHQHYVTRLDRRPGCRFDHQTWEVSPLGDISLAEALEQSGCSSDSSELTLEGDVFVGELRCYRCGAERAVWRPRSRLSAEQIECASCQAELAVTGLALRHALSVATVPGELLERPLSAVGVLPRDLVSIRAGDRVRRFELIDPDRAALPHGASVILAGCGNIGSHLVPQLARLEGVGRVLLVDPDVYEERNLAGQEIRQDDVGRPKVAVQAERIRAVDPSIEVEAVATPLEAIPIGHYRGALILGALDSRRARQDLNARAFRVGSPWIDMAVHGEELLCRLSVYWPGPRSVCLECAWSDDDYRLLEQRLPCAYRSDSGALDQQSV